MDDVCVCWLFHRTSGRSSQHQHTAVVPLLSFVPVVLFFLSLPLFFFFNLFLQEEVELSRRGGGAEQTPDVVRIG